MIELDHSGIGEKPSILDGILLPSNVRNGNDTTPGIPRHDNCATYSMEAVQKPEKKTGDAIQFSSAKCEPPT